MTYQENLESAYRAATLGLSEAQILNLFSLDSTPEVKDKIALGHEQCPEKSLHRRFYEDGDIDAGMELLRRLTHKPQHD